MESLLDIELPPPTTTATENCVKDDLESEIDNDNNESNTNSLIVDNNKCIVVPESQKETDSPKKITLTIGPPSKTTASTPPLTNLNKISIPPLTNTDNLLNLNNLPKVALLGKEQAKKRLQAFSMLKSMSTSPISKKVKSELIPIGEKRNSEKKTFKKVLCSEDKAKAVIEEIEEIKKIDSTRNQNQMKFKHKYKDKFKNKSKSVKRYRQQEKTIYKNEEFDYPENWEEFNLRHLTFDSLKQITHPQMDRTNSFDYKRHANFELPPVPVHNFKYKDANGEEKEVPFNFIRYTYKSSTTIAYSPNMKMKTPKYFTRHQFFNMICKPLQEEISKLINKSSSDRRQKSHSLTQRNWYPKCTFDYRKECEILEHSLGLSILKAYSDEEDENFENVYSSVKAKRSSKNETDEERKSKTHKSHKKKRKKLKKTKKSRKSKTVHSEKEKTKSKNKRKDVKVISTEESCSNREMKPTVEYKMEVKDIKFPKCEGVLDDVLNDVKKNANLRTTPITALANEENLDQEEEINEKEVIPEIPELASDAAEHNSHWESDEEITNPIPIPINATDTQHNENWTKKNTIAITERSLEMPLTLTNFTRRTSIPLKPMNSTMEELTEVQKLEQERKLIEEERRKIEIEKKRLAEMERIYKLNILNSEKNLTSLLDNSSLLNLSNVSDISSKESETNFKIKEEKPSDDDNTLNNSLTQFRVLSENVNNCKKDDSLEKDQSVLETEYEEFMKAVTSDISQDDIETNTKSVKTKTKKRRYSTSSSSSSSSETEVSSGESAPSLPKENLSLTFDIQSKDENLDLPDALLPILDKKLEMPRPVPVPSSFNFNESPLLLSNTVDSTTTFFASKNEEEPQKSFNFPKLCLPSKKNLLVENSAFNDSDNSNTNERFENNNKVVSPEERPIVQEAEENSEKRQEEPERKRSRSPSISHKEKYIRNKEPSSDRRERRRDSSWHHRRDSPKKSGKWQEHTPPRRKRESSPKRSGSSRKRESPSRRNNSSPRRRDASPRRWKSRDRSYSPRSRSPRNYPHRNHSPKRMRRRDSLSPRRTSPKNHSLSPDKRAGAYNTSPASRKESIQATLQRIAGLDDYSNSNKSPVDSPLDGFKRSLADSTISDEQLLQQHNNYSESPYNCNYFQRTTESPASPKRISLDDRINQVLGIDKEPQKSIYHEDYNYNAPYYDQYYNQQYDQYNNVPKPNYSNDYNKMPTNKVLQVGNVLQVVPTEDVIIPAPISTPNRNKEAETVSKIVQVGNMLQIVPTESPQTTCTPSATPDKPSAETLMKQKNAERRAEREKRRNERERRRKEKEKKRKEKEKRKQLKLKLKTENMIKRALLLETEDVENENVQDNEDAPTQWPPAPIVISSTSKITGKGILLSHGFSTSKSEDGGERKKSVKFADGVIPGEGTSPSGGEELTSPPPATQKLPKEKRFRKTKMPKKIKIPKKKKIKVQIVRKQNLNNDLDSDEDDNLPPPSPPPGSPPPHIFPQRIKTHTINNLHSSFQANMPALPVNNNYSAFIPPNTSIPPPSHHHHSGPPQMHGIHHSSHQPPGHSHMGTPVHHNHPSHHHGGH